MSKQTPSIKYDEFSKSIPSLPYFVYAKTEKLYQTETDIGYKAMLKLLKEKGGSRLLRRIAATAEEKFRTRNDAESTFGKLYAKHWVRLFKYN